MAEANAHVTAIASELFDTKLFDTKLFDTEDQRAAVRSFLDNGPWRATFTGR
ncbi:MAG: hypothetical protein ACRDQ1_01115 [Sciscionella sp.]